MIRIHSFAFIAVVLVSGCATLFSGSDDNISFTSDPPNVKVYMNTRYLGVTPLNITVKRVGFATANLNTFRFEKKGHRAQEFRLTTEFNNVTLLNTISIVSYLTDAFTGAITQYSPTDYHIILEKSDQEQHSKSFRRRTLVQSYILVNYYDLRENIVLGNGVHINNLSFLLNIGEEHRDNFLILLKSEMLANRPPPEFLVSLNEAMRASIDFKSNSFL